jgi:hypothetical protein
VAADPVPEILWSPIDRPLLDPITRGDNIILVIAPFITSAAIRQLTTVFFSGSNIKVICRWRPSDFAGGAADLTVYPVLRDLGCELYINPELHAKLYVYGSNRALLTSGNLTLAGLGLGVRPNLEAGVFVRLCSSDWDRIFALLESSRHVDEAIYLRFKEFVERLPKRTEHPDDSITLPEIIGGPKRFTIASLPATLTPTKLADFYFGRIAELAPEDLRRANHDLFVFKIQPDLEEKEFSLALNSSFRRSPFVVEFVELLQKERNLRFGAVKDWMHQLCEDVPLPYKWELNENVRIFYDWLAHFYPEISWDRPNFSQVIYWNA